MRSVYRPLLFPPSPIALLPSVELHRAISEQTQACEALRNVEEALSSEYVEAAVLACEDLARCCEDSEVLMAVNASIVYCLGRRDLVLAREHASRARGYAKQMLGLAHPLSVELFRWELHFMTFTLMSDIAIRQYPQLLSLAKDAWGKQSVGYWYVRCEELIARSFARSDHYLALQYCVLQEQMEPILGRGHPLYLLTMLFLGHHYWEDGNRDLAKQTIQTLRTSLEYHTNFNDELPLIGKKKFCQHLSYMAQRLCDAYAHVDTVNVQTLDKIWAKLPDVPTLAAPEVEKQGTVLGKLT